MKCASISLRNINGRLRECQIMIVLPDLANKAHSPASDTTRLPVRGSRLLLLLRRRGSWWNGMNWRGGSSVWRCADANYLIPVNEWRWWWRLWWSRSSPSLGTCQLSMNVSHERPFTPIRRVLKISTNLSIELLMSWEFLEIYILFFIWVLSGLTI